jgi:hypothetical protein
VLVAPDKGTRATLKRWLTSGRAASMRTVLKSDYGHQRYRKRKQTVEPLFGNTNTTAASTASTGAAGSRCASSGGY